MRYLSIFLLCFSLYVTMSSWHCAEAQDTKAQERKRERLQQEIEMIDRQLRENADKSSSALNNLELIRKKVSNRNELIAESDRQIGSLSGEIDATQKEVESLQRQLDTLSYYYSRLVKSAYKNRDPRIWYIYVMASDNIGQAFRRIGYLRTLSSRMNLEAEKIVETSEELKVQKQKLEALRLSEQSLKNQRLKEVEALHKEEVQSQNTVDQLKRNRAKYQRDLATKKKQVDALNREIERIIREAIRKEQAASGKDKPSKGGTARPAPSKPVDYKLDKEFASNRGKLPWPADGPVVEAFGQRYHPVFTSVMLPFNNGVNIALEPGTKVKSVFDGVVKQIVVMPGYNKCVLVQHGNYFSFYCKLSSVNVKAGDKVKTSEVLGTVDTINGETQLHLQIWKGTTPQNPEQWLRP